MPQHVCPSGKSTATPSRRKTLTMATPTSGKNMSPRQVIMSEALTPLPAMRRRALPVRRRRGDHDQHQQRLGAFVDQSVVDSGRRHERVAGSELLLLPTEREAPPALEHVVDLVLVV